MVTLYQKGLFADKSTLILRALLQEHNKQWRTRELAEQCGISQGLVSRTVVYLEKLGYAQTQKGRNGYIRLVNVADLLKDWVSIYDFSLNSIVSLYSPDENILPKLKAFLLKQGGENCYALTLHTGANLMTNYVRDPNLYVYLLGIQLQPIAKELQIQLGFKKLVHGGNVHLIQPYYKNSIPFDLQKVRGFKVVSNLQLYLDLYHFAPRGIEHAEHLKKVLEERKRFP